MSDRDETVDVEVPPRDTKPSDVSMLSPDATDEMTFTFSETGGGYRDYWETIELEHQGLADRLYLQLTFQQMRNWVSLFENYVRKRERALDERFSDAWCMYAVTVEKYPRRPVSLDTDVADPDPKEHGRTPQEADTVATCWTEKAAFDTKSSLLAGEHPDYDPLDFDCEFYVRVEPVPILSEDQTPPWEKQE